MATKAAGNEDPLRTLKYRTCVLKVSIDCEGCKRKIKKILQSIEGVYTIDIDAQQHKVTVTGDVDAETLIKKLARSGKYAEVLPEKKQQSSKNFREDEKPHNHKPAEKKNDALNGLEDVTSGSDNHEVDGSSSASSKKKKKKKNELTGHPISSEGDNHTAISVPESPASPPVPAMPQMNLSHRSQLLHPYPPGYYAPQAYSASYSMAPYPDRMESHYPVSGDPYSHPAVHLPPYGPARAKNDEEDDYGYDEDDWGCSLM